MEIQLFLVQLVPTAPCLLSVAPCEEKLSHVFLVTQNSTQLLCYDLLCYNSLLSLQNGIYFSLFPVLYVSEFWQGAVRSYWHI